jgi:hypothetical protein
LVSYIPDWDGGLDNASGLDICTFVSRYTSITTHLCGKYILDNYEVIHGFLQGLPRKWRSKLIPAKSIDYDNLQNVDF